MLFRNMGFQLQINFDRHQSIHSFFKTPKMQLTSKLLIFVVTNYLRTRSSKEVQRLIQQSFRDSFAN